jgi:hypothetical protein
MRLGWQTKNNPVHGFSSDMGHVLSKRLKGTSWPKRMTVCDARESIFGVEASAD